jgi:hypothetical protein
MSMMTREEIEDEIFALSNKDKARLILNLIEPDWDKPDSDKMKNALMALQFDGNLHPLQALADFASLASEKRA